MTATDFTFKLLLLFFPGIISFIIVESFTDHRKVEIHQWGIYSFVLGLCNYLTYYLICRGYYGNQFLMSFQRYINGTMPLDFAEISWVSLIAVVFGFVVTAAINMNWFFGFARLIKVTNKYSEPSLLSFLIGLDVSELDKWVRIRDFESDIIFEGYIRAYSDPREGVDALSLENTRVYQLSTGKYLYDVPMSYIPIKEEKMIIEFYAPCRPMDDVTKQGGD